MSTPVVSIVMPCFNHGEFVLDAAASALGQEGIAVELIIVNDGSTDAATNRILEEFSHPLARVIQSENRGPAAARNLAISSARGRYVLPLDADDRIAPGYARDAAAVLDAQAGVGIVYGGAEYFGERSGTWPLPPFDVPAILLENLVFNSMVFRRSDWERTGGYDEQMREGWEDWDFVLSLVALGVGVQQLQQTVYFHRVRTGSRDDSLDRAAHIRCYRRMFENHRSLYLNHVDYLFGQLYDLRHVASQQKHLRHRIESLEYRLAHAERVAEARKRQLDSVSGAFAEHARLASAPLWRLAVRRGRAAVRREPAVPAGARNGPPPGGYDAWFRAGIADEEVRRMQVAGALARAETETMCVVSAGEESRRLAASLARQWYANWEMLLLGGAQAAGAVPQGRVRAAATGDFADAVGPVLVFPDGDGELTPDALATIADVMARYGADFVYADYGGMDTANRYGDPRFLPDFSPDLLLAGNYPGGIFAMSRELLHRCGGLRQAPVGAGRHELVLRATAAARLIYHLPQVIYHAPGPIGPVPDPDEPGVISAAAQRAGMAVAGVEAVECPGWWAVRYRVDGAPRVSILLTSDDAKTTLALVRECDYPDLEIVLGVADPLQAHALQEAAGTVPVRVIPVPAGNAAAALNVLAQHATGEHLVFLNDALRPRAPDWIWPMLEYSQRSNVGAVGGWLTDTADRMLHAGYVVGTGRGASDRRPEATRLAPHSRWVLQVAHNVIGVSADWLMLKRFVFEQLGGFDTDRLATGLHDVDLCLRLHETGFLNVFTPHARGKLPADARTFATHAAAEDWDYFHARYHRLLALGDPYYNRHLDRRAVDCTPAPWGDE